MTTKQLKWLAYAATLFVFLATFGGGVVTKTESGLGCGSQFPLCNGKFVPAHTLASIIEYSHRGVSGLAGILALAAFVAFMIWRRNRLDLRIYAFLALLFVIIQAAMGALAVVFSQSAPIMALHLGFALISFASSVMLSLGIREQDKQETAAPTEAPRKVSKGLRNLSIFTAIYTYLVVYTGAYVTHTDSAGACYGFPLCNGKLIPPLAGGEGIQFMHRAAAFLLFVVIAVLAHFAYRNKSGNREVRGLGLASIILIVLQIFAGISVTYTVNDYNWYLFTSISHILIIEVLFGLLCYMAVRTSLLSRGSK
ncbi:COX15/CtaA family protein [Paenibacillus physcomitrellae]|uniref:Heme A synthase n=1 Tax=Paenibacillus physcomitrellae TaxID=1619311 RepID=A0ABQ1G4E6_9BACL|nr:heme A synthase [Paenibacillus physcomitrellae]GGA35245.1 heme A synthase [Paenibacillus physcomitrellae]